MVISEAVFYGKLTERKCREIEKRIESILFPPPDTPFLKMLLTPKAKGEK